MTNSRGTVTFLTGRGTTVTKDILIDDAAGELTLWDEGAGGATGENHYMVPEDMRLVHLATQVSTTPALALRVIVNGTPTQHLINHNFWNISTLVASSVGAPPLNIGLKAGSKLALMSAI